MALQVPIGPEILPRARGKSSVEMASHIRTALAEVHTRGPHTGSSFSVVDILAVLFFNVMRGWDRGVDSLDDAKRDMFILSKGHSVGCLYATLSCAEILPSEHLGLFSANGTKMFSHPVRGSVPGVEVSTGSLGHGLAIGIGVALDARLKQSDRRVFLVLGDGECQEGSVWEAAAVAARLGLTDLTVIVDENGFQDTCSTGEIQPGSTLAEKWSAFGWDTVSVDGHDHDALVGALQSRVRAPRAIIARTIKGKGVRAVEGTVESHHYRLTEEDRAELVAAYAARSAQ